MYGYVYLTIDNLKGYFYIGQHKSETYDEKYFGSGLRIHNIIKKRGGTETLRNYILQKCDSKEILNLAEQYWIQCYKEQYNNRVLNIAEGGLGGNLGDEVNDKISSKMKGRIFTEEWKKNLSDSQKISHSTSEYKEKVATVFNSKEYKENMSKAVKAALTQEVRDKMSKSRTGKIWVHNEFERTVIYPEQLEEYLNNGFERGKGKYNK